MTTQTIETTKTAKTNMKITLPVGDMIEGLRRGCAAALLHGRQEKLVRFTVAKTGITFESERDKHRVIHRLPVVAPIMVEKEGSCFFQGAVLYEILKTMKLSPKHVLTLEHTIAKKGQSDIGESRQLDEIKWSVYEDGAAISSGALWPYSSCAMTELLPMTHEDVPLLELYRSEAKQIIEEMMRLAAKQDFDTTIISLREGSVKLICIGGTHVLERHISPSEYIDALAGKHDIGMSMEGMKILDGILSEMEGIGKSDKFEKSIKLRLSGNGVQFIWEVGSTKLYFPVLPVLPSKRLGYIPFGDHTGTPSLSFTVEADMLTKRLAHAVCANMRPSEAHACIDGILLCFKYRPTAKDNYPGEATMFCHDVEGDSTVSFSFDPKLIHSFAKKNEGKKIIFEIIPLKNSRNKNDGGNDGRQIESLLRLRSTGNPKVTLMMGSKITCASTLTNPVP